MEAVFDFIVTNLPLILCLLSGVALLVVGFLFVGRDFGVKTVFVSVLSSTVLSLLERFCPMSAPLTGEPVLELIFAIVLPAVSAAILFNVGASGGGKSTMCHLIPRFYDVKDGAVLIDGQDVRKVTQESLRRHIGIIQQDVFLFAGTVMDNIRYGKPDATDEEIVRAAIRAEIHDDIMQMPEGYRTYVGERGIQLSGGQKQRISIARVFLKNPRVLILDEATSALDSVTEQKIQESLERLSVGKTCIVIAHRLSTVRNADRIAVVEGKHIPEQGTRQELLERNGIYAALERARELSDVSEKHE